MAIFHSYFNLPQGIYSNQCHMRHNQLTWVLVGMVTILSTVTDASGALYLAKFVQMTKFTVKTRMDTVHHCSVGENKPTYG